MAPMMTAALFSSSPQRGEDAGQRDHHVEVRARHRAGADARGHLFALLQLEGGERGDQPAPEPADQAVERVGAPARHDDGGLGAGGHPLRHVAEEEQVDQGLARRAH